MNGFNQQYTRKEMYGWPQGMSRERSDTDCGMPPSMIPPMNLPVNQPAAPPMNQPAAPWMQPANPAVESCMLPLGMLPLGMSYVPMQKWSQPSPLEVGFRRGTMFQELDLPFLMGRCQ